MAPRILVLLVVACAAAQETKPILAPETRGDIFMAEKKYREAIDAYRDGSPRDPVLLNKTGIAYHQLQELNHARREYEQALKVRPDYVEVLNNIGTTYYAQKSYRRAIRWYNRALKLAPGDPKCASIYMNLGYAQFARKQYEKANQSYAEALKLDPNVFEHHGTVGVILEERTVEERAKFHFYLARLYAQGGRNEMALQYLRKCLEEGFKEKKKLEEDPSFAGLRKLPEFQELLHKEPRVL